jgi:hypothetical protein
MARLSGHVSKHVRVTGDLVRFGLRLTIECGGCGSTNILSTAVLAQIGARTPLASLQRRLRCSHCDAHAARLHWVSDVQAS